MELPLLYQFGFHKSEIIIIIIIIMVIMVMMYIAS